MSEVLASLKKIDGGGTVGERYDLLTATAFTGVAPTFTTKGRPKAVWMSFKRETVSEMSVVTNVNPYTGEVEQGKTYRSRQGSAVIEDLGSQNPFIITDNSVGFTTSISGAKVIVICSYTY